MNTPSRPTSLTSLSKSGRNAAVNIDPLSGQPCGTSAETGNVSVVAVVGRPTVVRETVYGSVATAAGPSSGPVGCRLPCVGGGSFRPRRWRLAVRARCLSSCRCRPLLRRSGGTRAVRRHRRLPWRRLVVLRRRRIVACFVSGWWGRGGQCRVCWMSRRLLWVGWAVVQALAETGRDRCCC